MADFDSADFDSADFDSADFDSAYKQEMVRAYPFIASGDLDKSFDLWTSTTEEKEQAFGRILAARSLARTHEMYLNGVRPGHRVCEGCSEYVPVGAAYHACR